MRWDGTWKGCGVEQRGDRLPPLVFADVGAHTTILNTRPLPVQGEAAYGSAAGQHGEG